MWLDSTKWRNVICDFFIFVKLLINCWHQSHICSPKQAIQAIKKKLMSQNPHTAFYSLLVLESVVKNCGSPMHDEIATKENCETFTQLVETTPHENVKAKMLELIQAWAYAFRTSDKYQAVKVCCVHDSIWIALSQSALTSLSLSPSLFRRRIQWQFWRPKVTLFPSSKKRTQCSHRTRRLLGTMASAVTTVVPNFRLHCANTIAAIVAKYFAVIVRQRRARCQNSASKRKFVCATCATRLCKSHRRMHRLSALATVQTIYQSNIWIVRWRNNRKWVHFVSPFVRTMCNKLRNVITFNQTPVRKTDQELKEEEELQLALALSQSEAEQKSHSVRDFVYDCLRWVLCLLIFVFVCAGIGLPARNGGNLSQIE